MLNNIRKNKILKKLNKGEEISPFLFISENLELLDKKIEDFWLELLQYLWVNKLNLYKIKDNWESIKISQVKDFFSKIYSKNPEGLQIFLIENISRFTLQAANSVLKVFEEPGQRNLIFLTNKTESGVLDTILSRVQVYDLKLSLSNIQNNFYKDLILDYISGKNQNLINYFFKNKLEKPEYLDFLKALIEIVKIWELNLSSKILEELYDDINFIQTSPTSGRSIVDKWILLINSE